MKDTNLSRYGVPHNFCKDHPSRKKWENRLLIEEGITNVRQRQAVIAVIQSKGKITKINNGLQTPDDKKTDWMKYKQQVMNLSNKTYKKYKHKINPNNVTRGRNAYHLDHIYPIRYGFLYGVPVERISNSNNLRMLEC